MGRRRKPVTRRWLDGAIARYLSRYAAPRRHVRRIMQRKMRRSFDAVEQSLDFETATEMLDELLDKYVEQGAIDDERYVRSQVGRLLRRGASTRKIKARMHSRGVDGALVEDVLREERDASEVDPELRAACQYVRRRRIGPCRPEEKRRELREKDLGRLARRGFTYRIASTVLDLPDKDAVEAVADGRRDPLDSP